jgi:hypothetical protein
MVDKIISDIIRHRGYDGIKYNSSVASNGKNVVIFDRKKIDYIKDSSKLYKILRHSFSYNSVETIFDSFINEYQENLIEKNDVD